MRWNSYDFVLSTDIQFNGASFDYCPDIEAYKHADIKTEYQTIVSPELSRVYSRAARSYESADQSICAHVRAIDHQLPFPAEFFQCLLQKPSHYVDFKGRVGEIMDIVRRNHTVINGIFHKAFAEFYGWGAQIDKTIYSEVDTCFRFLDDELRSILKGYLTQKPQRSIFMLDIESSPASFDWLEPVYQTLKWHLRNYGLDFIASVSGKGYHFISQIPLYTGDYGYDDGKGHLNYAMINLMAVGGAIRPETVDHLVSVRWGSRKLAPTPLLSQRAYQGMIKLQQFFAVNTADEIRRSLSSKSMAPWVNFTDSENDTVILDLTSMLRQSEMAVFGSVGSLYNKSRYPYKVRLIRSRNGHEYFNNDLSWMHHTRNDLGAAKMHLVHSGGRIPDGTRGIENMLQAYSKSRIKRELHDPCDRDINSDRIRDFINSNYREIWRRCPSILHDIEKAQPNFLSPQSLKWVYEQMANKGFSILDMMTLSKAVYCDPVKRVDIDPKYSKDEWCRWPAVLMGEWFKG